MFLKLKTTWKLRGCFCETNLRPPSPATTASFSAFRCLCNRSCPAHEAQRIACLSFFPNLLSFMILMEVNSLVFIVIVSSVTVSSHERSHQRCWSCRAGNQLLKSCCVAEYPEGWSRIDWQCFLSFILHYLITFICSDSVMNHWLSL